MLASASGLLQAQRPEGPDGKSDGINFHVRTKSPSLKVPDNLVLLLGHWGHFFGALGELSRDSSEAKIISNRGIF